MQTETLNQQYSIVANETNLSSVMQYGDTTFTSWAIGTFEGDVPAPTETQQHLRSNADLRHPLNNGSNKASSHWDARHATLLSLEARLAVAGADIKPALQAELELEYQQAKVYDAAMGRIATKVFEADVDDLLQQPLVITQWDCYKAANAFLQAESGCGRYTDYSLRYSKVVAMLCERAHGNRAFVSEILGTFCDL
jgi:hypothetical protein